MNLEKRIKLAQMDPELVAGEIGNFIVERVLKFKKTGGVIGLSGGVDSTVAAALAKRAFDAYNKNHLENPLELVGYILPSKTNDPKDAEDGIKVAKRLCIRYEIRSIEDIVEAYKVTNPEALNDRYHRGNLTSEMRAVVLHGKAATENKSVIGTGNRDEDYGLAYYTLFGDGAVHMSPLGRLPKRLVRQMAVYVGFGDLAYRISTPGLEHGQTSFKDLGYDYEFSEVVLEGLDQGIKPEDLTAHCQIIPYAKEQIKKYTQLHGKPKFTKVEEFIDDIIIRHKVALEKSKLVSPKIAKITLRCD
ncbi:MAG: NAD(+) synthase [Candidatus Woesearchaeota archaeon]|nr:NAD(+) synthase [Candidatus Woesearchaeota archaeon]